MWQFLYTINHRVPLTSIHRSPLIENTCIILMGVDVNIGLPFSQINIPQFGYNE